MIMARVLKHNMQGCVDPYLFDLMLIETS